MKTSDIIQEIKALAYHADSREMRLNADLVMQQITSVVQINQEWPMAVMARQGKPGILLGFNPLVLGELCQTPGQVKTVLVHESQHLLNGDLQASQAYKEERDWYHGWDGPMLHNWARDCQINDMLTNFGFEHVDGLYGRNILGRDTSGDTTEAVMRELAEKLQPPPSSGAGKSGDASGSAEAALAKADGNGEGEEVSREWSDAQSDRSASVAVSDEQARWERFMAETLDSSKVRESWRNVPKRYAGVAEFANRDAMLPRRTPLPRKHALIAIDVSGSMDAAGVNRLCNLVRNSGSQYELEVILFNTETKVWTDFRTNTTMPMVGGGTDFQPIEDYCLKSVRYPDAVLVLTDGQADLVRPSRPKNWVWVIYGNDVDYFRNQFQMRSVDLDAIIKRRG